jgi:uncharacterized protein (TIGR02099 family)
LTQYRIFSHPKQSMALPGRPRWFSISSLWAYRVLTWGVLAAGLAFAALVLALRYWILPNVATYREDIARIVSESARQKVTIGKIQGSWDGLRPQLVLERITVFDAAGRPALELERIDNTLSWLSLPALELRFHALDIYRPMLTIRRDERGIIAVGGIELAGGGSGGGFADWLLRQRDVEVRDATIVWNDEQRGAPPLTLKNVSLQLFNRGDRHQFGLRATPPRELAAPLDVRGDLSGDSLTALGEWNGKLFLQLDYVDIAAWRTWIPFPVHFPRGAGALRAWLSFSHDQVADIVADVRLANVLTRLAADLPQLDLKELSGRLGWKQSDGVLEISTSRLGLTTTGGLTLPPADLLLRIAAGDERRKARGELHASVLELAPIVSLADHLPLGGEARKLLAKYSPRGGLHDVVLSWSGEWSDPQEYSVRGRFRNVALNGVGKIPAFQGVSGVLDADERSGTLYLDSRKASVEMPLVFRDRHEFETLVARVNWMRSGGETELRLNSVSFSNAHLTGTLLGVYRTAGATSGSIDLTGNLSRADARFVGRYIPLRVAKTVRDWLDAAFIGGQSNSVSLRLKGNLDDFPFPESRGGVFQVTARLTGGVLHYANGWPNIENIAGDVVFRGTRMDAHARQGTILGARLSEAQVEIPDLLNENEVLNVSGNAEGPTADFFRFIEESPVAGMTDHFTEGWRAQGSGKLALKFSIPLRGAAKRSIAGAYQFANNSVVIAPGLPGIEQAVGRVEFTDSAVNAQGVKGVVLGGPVTITATTARDATVRVSVQGRMNADNARRSGGPQWLRHLRGATDWRAQIIARKRSADLVIESSLLGLAVDLPAPLVKTAAESLPVRFERRLLSENRDRVRFSAGDTVSMILLRRTDGEHTTITRGNVRFGGVAAEPDRNGVWVSGAVKALDVDRWRIYLRQVNGATQIEAGGVDLRLDAVDMLGRRFNELAVNASVQGGQWRVNVTGKELDGDVTWQPQGAGKLVARMKTVAIPGAAPGAARVAAEDPQVPTELPALDLVAEQFINKNRQLGRLEVAAVPDGHDWRIERLRLSNPEATFTLDGVWQLGLTRQRTQINLRLETGDIGKLLARLGHPEGVRGGSAKLEGSLSWAGAPYDLDFPTMSGSIVLEAAQGQFVKLDPGIGKLLGILSLQSLPRRISLDFRDVFSEGFAFDEIAGAVKINHGTAATENFSIRGPAAHITMSGEVDIAQETQNLKVRITPQVSDTVSVAGALVGGPVAGVAAFLAQKVLKDPLGKIITFDYSVTGGWSDPVVRKLPRPVAPPLPEAERTVE